MYDLPYDSCIHSDHRGSSIGHGYSGSIFGNRNSGGAGAEESKKEDPENGSIQFSIQSNELVQQDPIQRSSIEEIRRKALLLKQKFKMIHRYDEDLLDMDSLYSQSNGGDALTEDNATTIFDSISGDQYQPEPQPVHHNSQHSFGSLYSASSSSGHQEGSECNGISDDPPLPRHAASNVEHKCFNEEATRIVESQTSSPWKFNRGSTFRTDPEPLSKDHEPESNECRFNVKTAKPPATFCPRAEEADVDSLYSVSHGEIEDILEELENDAENGLFVVENVELAHRLDQATEQGKRLKEGSTDKDVPHLVTTSSQNQTNERDVVSIHSFAEEESDDEYGYADLNGTTPNEVWHHEMEPKSATKFVIDLKTSIDKYQESVEPSSSLPSELEPVEVTWNSQQVELFLNEYKSLHQSKHEEVAALESRMQQYVAGEADMKKEIHTVVQKAESQQLELSTTKESLDEARQSLESQILDSENLRSVNARLEQKTADLVVSIQKCKSDAAEKKRCMERDYQNLKDSHVEMSQALEHKLAKFQCLVQDLQAHSRKLEHDQSEKLEEINERLGKHKRITKRYKKKYLSVCEKRDAMNDELKSQREKIESLRNQLQDQKTSTATTIADLKKKLRIKKKSKNGVKKTDAVCR